MRDGPSRSDGLAGWVVVAGIAVVLFATAWLVAARGDDAAEMASFPSVETIVYGEAPSEFGRLHLPDGLRGGSDPVPVVVLLHGGFWRRTGGDLSLMEPLARDLADRGVAVWNVEYGRTGERFGGWPHTLNHVGAAVDHLAELAVRVPMDLDEVTLVGHSAGGHLALWAAGREEFASRSAWVAEVDRPASAVSVQRVGALAPIADLSAAAADGLGNGAVVDLLDGTPSDVPVRYAIAGPQPSVTVEVLVVTGELDDTVPAAFSRVSGAGASVRSVEVPEEDHLRLIAPESAAWAVVLEWLDLS